MLRRDLEGLYDKHQEPNNDMKLSEPYLNQLRASVALNNGQIPEHRRYEGGEWETRLLRCSRRILSAVVFHEMAQITLTRMGSPLFPTIGFYYALFHAGIAMLCVECRTTLVELSHSASQTSPNSPGMTHKKLRRLLSERLVVPGLLDQSFKTRLDDLRKLREHVNYAVGGRLPGDELIYALEPDQLYAQVADCLNEAVLLIREISTEITLDKERDVRGINLVQITIGDHFGDDLIQMYVPREFRERIWEALARYEITS